MPATSFLAVCFPNMKHSYEIYSMLAALDEQGVHTVKTILSVE